MEFLKSRCMFLRDVQRGMNEPLISSILIITINVLLLFAYFEAKKGPISSNRDLENE